MRLGAAAGGKALALIRPRGTTARRGARGGAADRPGPAARRAAGTAAWAARVADHRSHGPGSEQRRRMADRLAAPGRDRAALRRADGARERAAGMLQDLKRRSAAPGWPAARPGCACPMARKGGWSGATLPLRDARRRRCSGVLAQGSTVAPLANAPAAPPTTSCVSRRSWTTSRTASSRSTARASSSPSAARPRRSSATAAGRGDRPHRGHADPARPGRRRPGARPGPRRRPTLPGETREMHGAAQERRGHADRA